MKKTEDKDSSFQIVQSYKRQDLYIKTNPFGSSHKTKRKLLRIGMKTTPRTLNSNVATQLEWNILKGIFMAEGAKYSLQIMCLTTKVVS